LRSLHKTRVPANRKELFLGGRIDFSAIYGLSSMLGPVASGLYEQPAREKMSGDCLARDLEVTGQGHQNWSEKTASFTTNHLGTMIKNSAFSLCPGCVLDLAGEFARECIRKGSNRVHAARLITRRSEFSVVRHKGTADYRSERGTDVQTTVPS